MTAAPSDPRPAAPAPEREWMPRIWEGCSFPAWMRLLWRNRLAVHPAYLYIAAVITPTSVGHSVLSQLQRAWFGDRIDRSPIHRPPLFIIGHWRTGTTLLHELLILDEQHTFPTTYQCLAPHHFLLTEWLFPRLFWWMAPTRRPMDNMPAGWDRPQEDEFALCMLGQPSPYLTIAFPNHPPQDQGAFDLEGLPPRALADWKKTFLRFLHHLSACDPRRLVLKSPTHSFRIKTLHEMFPEARFIHIVRNPYVVYPSTVNLWKRLYETNGLQTPTFAGLEEYVFRTFSHLYERIEQGKRLLGPGQFHELRYEDLIADPIGQMGRLYESLGLTGYDKMLPRMQQYLQENAGYQTNRYKPLDPHLQAEIGRRWGAVIERYGYAPPERPRE